MPTVELKAEKSPSMPATTMIVRSYAGGNTIYSSEVLFPWDIVVDDRRADPRRTHESQVWLISDDLEKCQVLGKTISISKGGVQIKVDAGWEIDLQPGIEILVFLDDPENMNPFLAKTPPTILRIIRVDNITGKNNYTTIGAEFVGRHADQNINIDGKNLSRIAFDRYCYDDISDEQMGVILDKVIDNLLPKIHTYA